MTIDRNAKIATAVNTPEFRFVAVGHILRERKITLAAYNALPREIQDAAIRAFAERIY